MPSYGSRVHMVQDLAFPNCKSRPTDKSYAQLQNLINNYQNLKIIIKRQIKGEKAHNHAQSRTITLCSIIKSSHSDTYKWSVSAELRLVIIVI